MNIVIRLETAVVKENIRKTGSVNEKYVEILRI